MRLPGSLVGTLVLELRGLLFTLNPCNLQQFPSLFFLFLPLSLFFLFFSLFFFRDSRGTSMRFSPLLSTLGASERFSPKDLFIPILFQRDSRGASMRFSPLPSALGASERFSPKDLFYLHFFFLF